MKLDILRRFVLPVEWHLEWPQAPQRTLRLHCKKVVVSRRM
jgi:hypothetical protein